jgi:ABC-type proline/glycine betaine transport system permease subunit
VERFELLFLISLGLGVVISALNWQQLTQMAEAVFTLTVQAVVLLIMLGVMLLVSRKGSNIARWVLVVLFVLGAIMYIPAMVVTFAQNPVTALLSSVQIAFQVSAIYFVFRPAAKPWFQKTSE